MRRIAVVAVSLSLTACTSGLERGAEAISGGAPVPEGVRPTGATGATADDGEPAIVVRTPVPGDEIVSPVQVTGSAFVAAGSVSVAIVDATGVPLASTSATTRCGAGCRGRYAVELAFLVEQRQAATIRVFEVSVDGGNAVNVVTIPVTLVPGG